MNDRSDLATALPLTGVLRFLLMPAIFLTGIASGLVAWFWLMAAILTGLNIGVAAIAAVACTNAYLCGLTFQRLKRGEERPWTLVGPALILTAAAAVVIFRLR